MARIRLPCKSTSTPIPRFHNPNPTTYETQVASRNEYDKTIMETEAAYMKILESSQTLLHVLKRESVNLNKKQQSSSLTT